MRKIIQITSYKDGLEDRLAVLCDDGTVWRESRFTKPGNIIVIEWRQVCDVPQPADTKENP